MSDTASQEEYESFDSEADDDDLDRPMVSAASSFPTHVRRLKRHTSTTADSGSVSSLPQPPSIQDENSALEDIQDDDEKEQVPIKPVKHGHGHGLKIVMTDDEFGDDEYESWKKKREVGNFRKRENRVVGTKRKISDAAIEWKLKKAREKYAIVGRKPPPKCICLCP